jgi:aminoglycoside phosphotransferase
MLIGMTEPLQLLTGPHAGRALAAAVNAAGGHLVAWRPSHVDHRSGRATVSYRTRVRWGRRAPRTEALVATTGGRLPAGVTVVDDGATRIGVWQLPHDPVLPALPAAMDPAAAARLLTSLGLGTGRVRPRLLAYRPRRRAVVEVAGGYGRLFLKVVRPERARDLHERHRLIAAAGVRVPRSLGWTDDGIVVLEALPGPTLREALRTQTGPWPGLADLTGLLARLPRELAEGPARCSWGERAPDYAAMVAAATPDLAAFAGDIAEAIRAETARLPLVPVHGDFYEQQILVDRERVCGLIDLDTVGPGDPLDDVACLLGHLGVIAQIWPDRASAIDELAARYLHDLERQIDPRQLRVRIAAVVLSLATGPHRVQEPGWRAATRRRLELAEQWITKPALRSPLPLGERGAIAAIR